MCIRDRLHAGDEVEIWLLDGADWVGDGTPSVDPAQGEGSAR